MVLNLLTITSVLTVLPRLISDLDDPIGVKEVFSTPPRAQYDFIVVGAGSAGSVVAGRLAQTGVTVLVLEAGEDGSYLTDIPGTVGSNLGTSQDWSYLTQPDGRSCLGMKGDQCLWHAGKMLGGGSAINGLLYVRGDSQDYDTWAGLGNPGWSWREVLPYFKKSEDQLNPRYAQDRRHHSVGGPIPVSDLAWRTPLSDAFVRAGHRAGFPVRDLNSGNATGFTVMQTNIRDGKRVSSAKGFLKPVADRPNLDILTHSLVERILFSGGYQGVPRRVKGVVFRRNGERFTVRARKEVILSAGVIGTPKILLLSGIGPREDLARLGIPLVADLPVGQNMRSHVGTGEVAFTLREPVAFNPLRIYTNPLNILSYLNRQGPLAAVSGFEGMGMYRTGLDPDSSYPDIQLYMLTVTPGVDGGLVYRRSLNFDDQTFSKWKPLSFKDGFNIVPVLSHPKSRGSVKLRSRDPEDPPIINPNYFDHPLDMQRMISAINFSLSLGNSGEFAKFGAKFYDRPLDQCRYFPMYSDQYWECAVRHFTYPLYHDCCTAPMGPRDSRDSVVDSQLRVHQVQGLRVADASVMPEIISSNTNAACVMIGEKAADLIRSFWKF